MTLSKRIAIGPSGIAAAAVLLAQAMAPTSAHAQTAPPAPAVIHACYVPLTGTLYRIDETGLRQGCTSTSHVEFSWTDGFGAVRTTDALTGDLGGTFAAPTVVGLQGHALSNTAPAAGQVLTFDGTQWAPSAATTSFTSATVNGPFLATGTLGSGSVPATGPGVRMMWYPGKSAFRVGRANLAEWDDANIGWGSIAMGFNALASGNGAVAIGLNPVATSNNSIAIGNDVVSTAEEAVAFGLVARATATAATALGDNTTASGEDATAMGHHTVASGESSTAMGQYTTASGTGSAAIGSFASTNGHDGSFVFGDGSTNRFDPVPAVANNQFVVRAQNIWLGTNNTVTATAGRFLETSTGAYLSTGGVWTNVSDVNKKQAFEFISGEDVLTRLAAMPIEKWSYKSEDPSIRHLGPTAQDFYAAFHLGLNNTSIGTIDADGVSLAAIKALEQRTRDLKSENEKLGSRVAELAAENARLRARNGEIDARLDALETALAQIGATPRRQ